MREGEDQVWALELSPRLSGFPLDFQESLSGHHTGKGADAVVDLANQVEI
jgi:hypothetical protein